MSPIDARLRHPVAAVVSAALIASVWTGVPAEARAAVATTRAAAADAGSATFEFVGSSINGYRQDRIRTGTGTDVRLTPSYRWQGYDIAAIVLHLSVERDTGAGWRTVAAMDHPVGPMDVVVPRFSTSQRHQVVRYRLRSAAYSSGSSTVLNDSSSDPVTVVYEDQRRYTGLAKRMYGLMKSYCPGAAVHVVDSIDGIATRAGQASGGSQSILVRRSVRSMPEPFQRALALHECAHLRQWLNYGASPEGDRARQAVEAASFVNDGPPKGVGFPYSRPGADASFAPQEHAADCASIALNPKGYLGYGGWCSPKERKRGARLLAGLQYDGRPGVAR